MKTCDLLLFGRELVEIKQADGTVKYEPSAETVRRADEAGAFWQKFPDKLDRIIASGGYPRLAQDMQPPSDGSNEASMMAARLRDKWNVQCQIDVESRSEHTFDNFSKSIEAGYLDAAYSPDHNLGLVVNAAQAPRVILIARYALGLQNDSLFRLKPLQEEKNAEVHSKEWALAKMTRLAIERATRDNPPELRTAARVQHLLGHFGAVWQTWEAQADASLQFDRHFAHNWPPEDIPVLGG